jgi:hypothetical protein
MDAKFFDPNRHEDDFQMRIDREGRWLHDGKEIARDRLIKLFSTVLHYDDKKDEYWLITPHEQGRVEVEDVPFIVTDYEWDGETLCLTTNLDHVIKPDAQNPLFLKDNLPYCTVINNVSARLNRQVREKLIHAALSQNGYNEDDKTLYLKANGHAHPLARS